MFYFSFVLRNFSISFWNSLLYGQFTLHCFIHIYIFKIWSFLSALILFHCKKKSYWCNCNVLKFVQIMILLFNLFLKFLGLLQKNVYSTDFGVDYLIHLLYSDFQVTIVLLLLTFCLIIPFIIDSGLLEFPLILLLSISPFILPIFASWFKVLLIYNFCIMLLKPKLTLFIK